MSETPTLVFHTSSTMTRRGFAAAALAAGAVAAAPVSARAAPQKGGRLLVGLGGGNSSDSLDPVTYASVSMYVAAATLGNFLVELGPDKRPIPELAESWDVSDGAKRWAFQIRQGVTFHNGKPLTSADVVYSLARHMGDDSKSAAKALLEDVASLEADGDYKVVVTLNNANADFDVVMADWHFVIVPEGHSDFSAFVGTGPYRLDLFEPGVRLAATRNENYWKSDRAWVDSVEVVVINDPTARLNALLTGDVHAINQVEPKIVDRLRSASGFQLIESPGAKYYSLAMRTKSEPFSNNHIRSAIRHAINREEVVAKTLSGFGAVGNDIPLSPSDPYYNTNLAQTVFDADKAKWHLSQAGVDRLALDLHVAELVYPGAIDAAVLMRETFAEAGVDVSVARGPNDGFWSNIWMKEPLVMVRWGLRPVPSMQFSLAFTCDAAWNDSYWCDDPFETLLSRVKAETDFETRKGLYFEMQEILHDRGGSAVFAFPSLLDGYSEKVGGAAPDSAQDLMGVRVAERVWLTT